MIVKKKARVFVKKAFYFEIISKHDRFHDER